MNTRAGANVYNKVSSTHGVLIVFHHQKGVAQIPQLLEGIDQLAVVPLMQADGRLIQNIQNAHEAGADLRCKANSLSLTAGESGSSPCKSQIRQTHSLQETQSCLDLPDDLIRNLRLGTGESQFIDKLQRLLHRQFAELPDGQPTHRDRAAHIGKPLSVAVGAGSGGHTLLQFLFRPVGLGLGIPPGHIGQNALKGLLQHTVAVAAIVLHLQFFSAGAVENHIPGKFRQLLPRCMQGKAVFLRHGGIVHQADAVGLGGAPTCDLNGALRQTLGLVRHHQIGVGNLLNTQAGADRAGAVGVVEREHPGRQLRHRYAAVIAGVVLGKQGHGVRCHLMQQHQTAGELAGSFNGIGQAAVQIGFQHQPIHHDLNMVLFVLFQGDLFRQIIEDPVHPGTDKAALAGILQYLGVLTLFAADHRSQQLEPGTLRQSQNLIHDLIDGLPPNFLAALGAVGRAHSGPEQAQIVIDLRHGTHGGTGVLGGGLLIDGNGGGKAVDLIHIGLVHLSEEHPGVGAEALHIPPLAFGIDGIKRQRGLAGAGKSRQHHQFIPRDLQINIL